MTFHSVPKSLILSTLLINNFILSQNNHFPLKDLGNLHYFLGIQVNRNSSTSIYVLLKQSIFMAYSSNPIILHITITIPDLAFVVNKVCQDMHCTKEPHLMAVN
ncbi:hypothetical protein MTR_3g101070 [Medicago truncatula]|uniref:Uncharacterized protein n=1 Tax=Medicago truncatula TaxID=3880 RepID=G7J5R3_MEDTR|nr:hypothetical protein MTR_3g101070 [Medicago truncatula]